MDTKPPLGWCDTSSKSSLEPRVCFARPQNWFKVRTYQTVSARGADGVRHRGHPRGQGGVHRLHRPDSRPVPQGPPPAGAARGVGVRVRVRQVRKRARHGPAGHLPSLWPAQGGPPGGGALADAASAGTREQEMEPVWYRVLVEDKVVGTSYMIVSGVQTEIWRQRNFCRRWNW